MLSNLFDPNKKRCCEIYYFSMCYDSNKLPFKIYSKLNIEYSTQIGFSATITPVFSI